MYLKIAVAALALAAAVINPIGAQQTARDSCSYVTDVEAADVFRSPVLHAVLSNETCEYRTTEDPNRLLVVSVISHPVNGSTPAAMFSSFLHRAKDYMHPIPGVSNAYTVGATVVALRNGRLLLTSVSGRGEPRDQARIISEHLALHALQQL